MANVLPMLQETRIKSQREEEPVKPFQDRDAARGGKKKKKKEKNWEMEDL